MIVALYGNHIDEANAQSVKHLFDILDKHRVGIVAYEPFHEFIVNVLGVAPRVMGTFSSPDEVQNTASLMLSIGGDGTFLDSVTFVQDSGMPIAGINFGRLGFLARIPIENIEPAVAQLVNREYSIENRTALKASLEGGSMGEFPFALNDLTLQKSGTAMINVNAFINDEYLCNYWADGIIVSTPTGSTAYSLSAGGPIVSPNSGTFILSPIAPHNLTMRSLIIPDHSTLTLEVSTRGNKILFSLDSRSVVVPAPVRMRIGRAPFDVRLICLPGETYYTTLRNKLMWGMDSRNMT